MCAPCWQSTAGLALAPTGTASGSPAWHVSCLSVVESIQESGAIGAPDPGEQEFDEFREGFVAVRANTLPNL
ncbi:MAG TPA: hypothetical protein VGM69_01990 [Chloroflexota bacterium]|jgi:hypothetical protein